MHIIEQGGVVYPPHQTMTSPDLVAIINSICEVEQGRLHHDDFMQKAGTLLGPIIIERYAATATCDNDRTCTVLLLPKRWACFMAMTYSYKAQSRVWDTMTALEKRAKEAPKLRKESYMTQLPEHQQRVVAEKQELDEKLGRLIKFVRSEGFTNIVKDAGERERLMQQETIMRDYSMILGERIRHF